jgi:hypothetical protein
MTDTLRPRIVLFQGDRILAVREVPPDHEWCLGRRPDSPLPLDERSISRQHVRLYCDSAGTHLEDLGTPNGTWVDGTLLRGAALLRDGQVVRLGQSTNADPLLLRFEDPASRLLDTLARVPVETQAAPPAGPAREDAGAGPSAPVVASEGEAADAVPASALAAAGPPLAQAPPSDEDAATSSAAPMEGADAPPRRPFLGLGAKAIVGAGLAFVAVFWLLWALKSTQKPWQAVRVEPLRAQAGIRVAIRGSEVEPADSLKVMLEDREAHIEEVAPGSLVFTVPELPGGEAGARAVTLRVERQGIVVLRQGLQYEMTPTIERLEPAEAAVGDVVAAIGGGFASDPSRLQVRVGGVGAAVVAAAPRRLEFRVPVVTRDVKVEAPVEVAIEGLRSAPALLAVRPREATCYGLTFTARAASPRVFEVWHSLGPAVLVEGAARAGASAEAEWPASVRQSVATLQSAFAAAPRDASVRFEVQGPALVARGLGGSPRVVTRLGSAVRQLLRERLPELRQPELLLHWQAAILNEMLDLFARTQPPRLLPASEPAGGILRRLHQLNAETGGRGCPTQAEVETMTGEERRAFESAAFRIPPRFGDVAGVWEGSFEAAAEQPSETRLEMQLELEQAGTTVKGRMFLFEVRGPGIRWSPPPIEGLTGRVRLDGGTSVELRLPPVPPHDITSLAGTVAEDTMEGTFRTSRGKQGRFHLSYESTP